VERHDPSRAYFQLHHTDLDVEVVVRDRSMKSDDDELFWSKKDGLRTLFAKKGQPVKEARILLCGDTLSDIPMLKWVLLLIQFNKNNKNQFLFGLQFTRYSFRYLRNDLQLEPLTVFVNPNESARAQLESEMKNSPRDHFCSVVCPEVLHVALLRLVNEKNDCLLAKL